MMTDLLNKFAYEGPYGIGLYWLGVSFAGLWALLIVALVLKLIVRKIALSIVQMEISRLETILVPKFFNAGDFELWLFAENKYLGSSPLAIIFSGKAHPLNIKLKECIKIYNVPELYDTILMLPHPTENSTKTK